MTDVARAAGQRQNTIIDSRVLFTDPPQNGE
jgi:hypothetical protein